MRDGESWRVTEEPENAYRFPSKAAAEAAISAYGGLVDGDWFAVEYRDEDRQGSEPACAGSCSWGAPHGGPCPPPSARGARQAAPSSGPALEEVVPLPMRDLARAKAWCVRLRFGQSDADDDSLASLFADVRRETIEACAKVCDEVEQENAAHVGTPSEVTSDLSMAHAARICAAKIRRALPGSGKSGGGA